MSSFFSTPSPIDKKVDAATSDSIAEPPLDLYLAIAEEIKASPDHGAAHLKSLRRRLTHKSPHTVFLALQLLDVAVKNGGDAFHELVGAPDFLQLISSIGTSAKEPRHVTDLALSLLHQWARAFPSQGLMSYAEAYNKLRNRGVAFPDAAGAAATAPVFTPPPNLTIPARQPASSRAPDRSPNRSPSRSPRLEQKEQQQWAAELGHASPAYVAKVKAESLQVVEYLTLFQQLIAAEPAPAQLKANESVQSLRSTIADCRSRVTRLLAEIEEEVVMDLMIQLNDAIRQSLDYYDDRVAGRPATEPTIVVPSVLRAAQQPAAAAGGERKEGERASGKEEKSNGGGGGEAAQGEVGEDPFVALANRPQPQQQQQQVQQQRPAAQQQQSSNSLDQFDPLA